MQDHDPNGNVFQVEEVCGGESLSGDAIAQGSLAGVGLLENSNRMPVEDIFFPPTDSNNNDLLMASEEGLSSYSFLGFSQPITTIGSVASNSVTVPRSVDELDYIGEDPGAEIFQSLDKSFPELQLTPEGSARADVPSAWVSESVGMHGRGLVLGGAASSGCREPPGYQECAGVSPNPTAIGGNQDILTRNCSSLGVKPKQNLHLNNVCGSAELRPADAEGVTVSDPGETWMDMSGRDAQLAHQHCSRIIDSVNESEQMFNEIVESRRMDDSSVEMSWDLSDRVNDSSGIKCVDGQFLRSLPDHDNDIWEVEQDQLSLETTPSIPSQQNRVSRIRENVNKIFKGILSDESSECVDVHKTVSKQTPVISADVLSRIATRSRGVVADYPNIMKRPLEYIRNRRS